MGYRDDLEAARARIERLEEDLEEAQADAAGRAVPGAKSETLSVVPAVRNRLLETRERLRVSEARVAELEHILVEAAATTEGVDVRALVRELEAARHRIEDLEAARRAMPITVVEHNRRASALRDGPPAGVLCPLCSLGGDRVEMCRCPDIEAPASIATGYVVCPRCRYLHLFASVD